MGDLKRLNSAVNGNDAWKGEDLPNGKVAAARDEVVNAGVSRREFLGTAAAAAAGFTIVPRHVLGGTGYIPPSDKVNIAFIGVGAQGLRVMLGFLKQPDVQGVAVCDVTTSAANYPQWDDHEFTKSVRELLGVDGGWEWLSPNEPIQLTHSLRVTSGVAGREPCQKIVNGYYGTQQRSGTYNGCAAHVDFRELLEKQKDVDAVVVCTTDNLHAAVSIAAMKKGKHVFCQKPLTHTIYEARRMAEVAKETGVATQIAVGNQASEATRLLCEWIWAGVIGPVREVYNWSSRPYWPQGIERPKESSPCLRRARLGFVARACARARFQSGLFAVCVARLGRFWLRGAGRHGVV